LSKLEEIAEIVTPQGGFWKALVRAAKNMELLDRLQYFENKFRQTPPRRKSD
jgi:hypothetical protein